MVDRIMTLSTLPKIIIESSSGEQALAEPILSGSVEKVLIDQQDFDIESVKIFR
ncbi:MAG: hypothetical protein CM15mP113_0790 [Pseudomonadota bacterium]|nr:MAG: hypothetical protein CM15mP113_0790 [Pseudomonadota bacterium]